VVRIVRLAIGGLRFARGRINSHICSIAYPILEFAGALSATRVRHGQMGALDEADRLRTAG
jgi:hypothetical protein